MDFTFGIITDGSNDIFLEKLIESILIQNIENYEIIIVGNTKLTNSNIIIIPFDESVHSSWITRKKNIIVRTAKYENIVLMHDYFILDSDWYNGFCKFGHDFDFCVNKIITKDGNRFRDYSIAPWVPDWFPNKRLLPYDYILDSKRNRLCYISGGFYIIKKAIALEYPLNEKITVYGFAEDILLSNNLTDNNVLIKVNPYSITKIQKNKEQIAWEKELNSDELKLFTSISDELIFEWIDSQRKWLSNFFKVKNVNILST
jgi:hypothetical protein